jgi:hypothetical protein
MLPEGDASSPDKKGNISHISYDKYLSSKRFCDNGKPYTHIICE